MADHVTAEFFLTQIVSHHSRPQVEQFLDEAGRRGVTMPGLFGVFYYRSANAKTLNTLRGFLPVPVDELTREFGDRRERGGSVRPIDSRAARRRRPSLLHQQPAARKSGDDAAAHHVAGWGLNGRTA